MELADLSVSAVLFDCDGVLVDSRAAAESAWTTWAQAYGVDPAVVLRELHGRRSTETVAAHVPPERHAAAVAYVDGLELETAHEARPIPGARELLASMDPRRYAVVTSAPPDLCLARMAGAGLPRPPALVTSEDVERGKPDPACYLLGAQRIGVAVEECVVFEDSPAGVQAARAAAAGFVVGVGPTAAHERVDAVVADLRQVRWADGRLTIR